ncbi:MAG: hypothetical protein NWE86_06600 [Candidatus Bathyarchaeota archaeon]|nr:hypothetical protein [Candidatus Bathyarchaeota archaeon]
MLIEILNLIASGDVRSKEELINKLKINGTTLDDIISTLIRKGYLQLKIEKKQSFCNLCLSEDNCKDESVLCKVYVITNNGTEFVKRYRETQNKN